MKLEGVLLIVLAVTGACASAKAPGPETQRTEAAPAAPATEAPRVERRPIVHVADAPVAPTASLEPASGPAGSNVHAHVPGYDPALGDVSVTVSGTRALVFERTLGDVRFLVPLFPPRAEGPALVVVQRGDTAWVATFDVLREVGARLRGFASGNEHALKLGYFELEKQKETLAVGAFKDGHVCVVYHFTVNRRGQDESDADKLGIVDDPKRLRVRAVTQKGLVDLTHRSRFDDGSGFSHVGGALEYSLEGLVREGMEAVEVEVDGVVRRFEINR